MTNNNNKTRKALAEKSLASWEDEKKEGSPLGCLTRLARTLQEGQEDEPTLEELQRGLPEAIKDKQYGCERDLFEELEELGLEGLRIIRNKDGYPIWREIAGEQHCVTVKKIDDLFNAWKFEHHVLATTEKECNIFVVRSDQGNMKQVADLGLYGMSRLDELGDICSD